MKKNSWCLVCILVVLLMVSQPMLASANIGLAYPTSSRSISNGYSTSHKALDFGADEWTPVKASAGGTVTVRKGCNNKNAWSTGINCSAEIGCTSNNITYNKTYGLYLCNGGYGNEVLISHGSGVYTRYAHLVKTDLVSGKPVSAGQTIGWLGSTGASTGPHLHFELNVGGILNRDYGIDPKPWLDQGPGEPPADPNPPPTGNVRVDYYNNINIQSGAPVYTEYIGSINRDWGDGGPGNGVLTDNFSARFTQQMSFNEGWYKFTYFADDGIKIWVDTVNKWDKWEGCANDGETDPIFISGGTHTLWVDLRENSGGARINVSVAQTTKPDDPPPTDPNPPPTGNVRVDYYNNINIQSGAPVYTEYIESINRDWGNGSPGNGVLTDNFSARFTQQMSFNEGWYKFTYFADDGIKIWVDTVNKWDKWEGCANDGETGPIFISGGTHTLWVDFRENGGGAKITVNVVPTEPLAVPVTVLPIPELILNVVPDKESAIVGTTITWTAISTGGEGEKLYYFTVYRDDVEVANNYDFSPDNKFSFTLKVPGLYKALANVKDNSDQIGEYSVTITIIEPLSDLLPTEITSDKDVIYVGDSVVLDATYINNGTIPVTGVNYRWLVDDVVSVSSSTVGIAAQATAMDVQPLHWKPGSAGQYVIEFYVDCDDFVEESNENNNQVTRTFTVLQPLPKPDLVPTEITCDVGTIYAGDSVVLDSGVVNRGTTPAEGFNIKWYVNDVEEGYGYHEGVPAASTVMDDNSAFYWTPAEAGDYYVVFFVDCDNSITEEDEDNNWTFKWFTVMEPEQTEPIDNGLSDVYFNAPQEPLAEGQAYEAFINLTGTDINALLINAKPTQGLTINELDVINSAWSIIIQTNDTYLLYGDPMETVEVRIEFTTNIINDGPHEESIHFSGEASPKGLIDSVLTMSVQPDTGTILLKGDADADGSVNIMDLVAIIDYIISDTQCESVFNADVNGDGVVDIMDLVWIIDKIVGG